MKQKQVVELLILTWIAMQSILVVLGGYALLSVTGSDFWEKTGVFQYKFGRMGPMILFVPALFFSLRYVRLPRAHATMELQLGK